MFLKFLASMRLNRHSKNYMNHPSLSIPIPNIQISLKCQANKTERSEKPVIICLHYKNFQSFDIFLSFTSTLSSIFGTKSGINQISDSIYVVESKCEDTIPSLKTLDECSQNVTNLPSALRKIDDETLNIQNQNEAILNEIYKLKRKKRVLISENQELERELNICQNELKDSKEKSQKIRSDCLKLIDSLFPPSAID